MKKANANPYRLDRNIEPVLYSIEWEPDLKRFTFQGTETITLKARNPFSRITLHALEIKVHKASLELLSGKTLDAKKIRYDAKFETVELDFGKTVKPSELKSLSIVFEGELNDKMHGFYRTSYLVNGEKRWGAATQFEATDARRAFPCWDEPDFKARFKVTLRVPQELTALSNMPVVSETSITGRPLKEVVYDVSPIMSTYLLCMVIADLEYVEDWDSNGTLIRVYTTPGKKEQGRFGLEVAKHTLPYFADWFGIPYALPKLDQVALPDFASGAMENWGLVTYRETALLVDEKNSSAAARQRVAEVVDHELAHQWFGNLVTMEWWTDLWLNEGFASYMGPKAVDHQFPEWKIWDQFMVMDYLTALRDDSLQNTHPIEIPVKNPAEIREIFDHITYSKGSVVNRMLEHYLSEPVFRKGLRNYLKKFAYKNAKTIDLWHALEKVSGKPVKKIMASYTKQGGYPVLNMKWQESAGKQTIELEQKRFFFDGRKDKEKILWNIPLSVAGRGLKKPVISFMDKRTAKLNVPAKPKSWIKMNPGQSGFYRVAYPAELLGRLSQAVAQNEMPYPVLDTLGILDDAWALARAGEIETSTALEVLQACKKQTDYNVWLIIAGGLGKIDHLLGRDAESAGLYRFALSVLSPIAQKMGWLRKTSDSHSDILLRSMLISQMGYYGDPAVIREAKKLFDFFAGGGELTPDLRSAVYSVTARHGNAQVFENLVKIYKSTDLQEEKVRVLRALTRFQDKAVIRKVLEFSLSPEVRNQDAYALLAGLGSNDNARTMNWNFIKENWSILSSRYKGSSVTLLGRILDGAAEGFLSEAEYEDVKAFFRKHPVPGTERTMKQCLEVIACNMEWKKRASGNIREWLRGTKSRIPVPAAKKKPVVSAR